MALFLLSFGVWCAYYAACIGSGQAKSRTKKIYYGNTVRMQIDRALEPAKMNGEEIPGLMNSVREWIGKNQDPETGLVFGLTVGEPLEIQTSKTYRFMLDTEEKHLMVIIWDKGCLLVEKADLTLGKDAPDAEVFQWEDFEFEEAEPLLRTAENFIRENIPQI